MATKTKPSADVKDSWYLTVTRLASSGVSNKSIAARLGISLEEFNALVDYELEGVAVVKEALALARAEFEISRVEIKDAILNDPETSASLKAKIVREDLKVLEDWAPATRAVKVTIEKAPAEFAFESFTQDELTQIAEASTGADSASSSTNE
jgi:hypothetical protein